MHVANEKRGKIDSYEITQAISGFTYGHASRVAKGSYRVREKVEFVAEIVAICI